MSQTDAQMAIREQPPVGRPAMRMRWAHLAFMHWRLDPERVQRLVPLPLDTWDGAAWIGLVPFLMDDVRVRTVPRRFRFPETNLRTYVIGPDGPGVWFFSLDAADPLAVVSARTWFGLNYRWARMRIDDVDSRILATSRRIRRSPHQALGVSRVIVERDDETTAEPAAPGTLEFFLLERYVLYAQRRRRIMSGRVVHVPYEQRPARLVEIEQDLSVAAGLGSFDDLPAHCIAANAVDVEAYAPRATTERVPQTA